MEEAKFVLKEPTSKDKTLFYLFCNFNYQRLNIQLAKDRTQILEFRISVDIYLKKSF